MKHQDIIQFNCNGLRGHINEINQLIIKYTPNFILLQEIKLKSDELFTISGYKFISKHLHGDSSYFPAVGILIKDGIYFEEIDLPDDICAIGINTCNEFPISLVSFYDNHRLNKLKEELLIEIINKCKYKALIMGDFNARNALWDNNLKHHHINDVRAKEIINFLNNSEYVLMNNGATTRISPIYNNLNSAIDLTFIHSEILLDFDWNVSNSMYGSDHLPILVTISSSSYPSINSKFWDTKNTKWNIFNEACDLTKMSDEMSICLKDEFIKDQIYKGLKASTPLHSSNSQNKDKKKSPWWDDELKQLKGEKKTFLKLYINLQTKESLINLKKFNAKFKMKLLEKKRIDWENYISELNGDIESKDLWGRINILRNKRKNTSIKHLLNEQNEIVEDPKIITNMLGEHYHKVSSTLYMDNQQKNDLRKLKDSILDNPENNFQHLDMDFSREELDRAIQNTSNTAPGSDGYKYVIYQKFSPRNKAVLLRFYNEIWRNGKRPKSWSKSLIIPVPKSPNSKYPSETRPINLINTNPKLFDKMVNSRLIFILDKENFLDNNQFGFRKNRQTSDSMIIMNNDVLKSLNDSSHTQMISFDVMKAFDTTWPDAIIQKLQQFKIGGHMYKYIQNFLGVRSFRVHNNSENSEEYQTDIGVPQGSPLSSTLFLIAFQHILDPLNQLKPDLKYLAYADDLLVYSDFKDNKKNTEILQKSIDEISESGKKIGLVFSYEKTKSIHICRKRNCNRSSNFLYGTQINESNSLKILGLIIQKNYKFDLHFDMVKTKLLKDLQLMKVLSSHKFGLDQELFKKIITALSIPKINYCIEIYGHAANSLKRSIDVVLNQMKRLMLNAFTTTPTETLKIMSGISDMNSLIIAANFKTYAKIRSKTDVTYPRVVTNNMHFSLINKCLRESKIYARVTKNSTLVSPQKSINHLIYTNIYGTKKDDMNPVIAGAIFKDFLHKSNVESTLYTDGSKDDKNVGYAVTEVNNELFKEKLHPLTSIFSAEALAILKAIQIIKTQQLPLKKYAVATDSLSVLEKLSSNDKKQVEVINQIKNEINNYIILIWVPGHMKIKGNEFADKRAKLAATAETPFKRELSVQDMILEIKKYNNRRIQEEWHQQIDNKYYKLKQSSRYQPVSIKLSKTQQMVLNRMKAGHSFLTQSHLIEYEDPPVCELCMDILTVEHIFMCEAEINAEYKLKYNITKLEDTLDDTKILDIFKYLKELDYFDSI